MYATNGSVALDIILVALQVAMRLNEGGKSQVFQTDLKL